jgi:hypothetical protein
MMPRANEASIAAGAAILREIISIFLQCRNVSASNAKIRVVERFSAGRDQPRPASRGRWRAEKNFADMRSTLPPRLARQRVNADVKNWDAALALVGGLHLSTAAVRVIEGRRADVAEW